MSTTAPKSLRDSAMASMVVTESFARMAVDARTFARATAADLHVGLGTVHVVAVVASEPARFAVLVAG